MSTGDTRPAGVQHQQPAPHPEPSGSQPLLAFVHIEKAAGTTLTHVLRDQLLLRYQEVRPLYPGPTQYLKEQDLAMFRRLNPLARCFGGHSVCPATWRGDQGPELRFITLLREPVRRYVSQFLFWRRRLNSPLQFEEFLDRSDTWNVQTKHIADNDNVAEAIETLHSRFLLAGLVERFDEFLLVLKHHGVLGKRELAYVPQNISPLAGEAQELVNRFGGEIRRRNKADMELYRIVESELFPAYLESCGDDIQRDLAQLRSRTDLDGRRGDRVRRGTGFLIRNLYMKPVTGLIRMLNGLPYKGSYVNY